MRRVAITGIGTVGPFGLGVRTFWDAVRHGGEFIRPISRFDAEFSACKLAGQVDDSVLRDTLEPRQLRMSSHATQLALVAGSMAVREAALSTDTHDSERFGVIVGTALGGWADGERQAAVLVERGARRVNPILAVGAGNFGSGNELAAEVGARGAHLTLSTGCTAGLQAIQHAANLIRSGELDLCLAGGTESPITPLTFAAFARTGDLEPTQADHSPSRPFDESHSGITLSEGSCFLLLEAAEHAERRGIGAFAEILGGATCSDAGGLFRPDLEGEVAARCLSSLLKRLRCSDKSIGYICSHANSSPIFDKKEARVLRRAFGSEIDHIPVSSIKGVLGHPFGASGAFQTAAAALALTSSTLPPTHNLKSPASDCLLHHIQNKSYERAVEQALITSYGYGGVNSFLVIGKNHGPQRLA